LNNKPLHGAKKKTLLFLEKEAKSSLFSLAGWHLQNSVLEVAQGLSLPQRQAARWHY